MDNGAPGSRVSRAEADSWLQQPIAPSISVVGSNGVVGSVRPVLGGWSGTRRVCRYGHQGNWNGFLGSALFVNIGSVLAGNVRPGHGLCVARAEAGRTISWKRFGEVPRGLGQGEASKMRGCWRAVLDR